MKKYLFNLRSFIRGIQLIGEKAAQEPEVPEFMLHESRAKRGMERETELRTELQGAQAELQSTQEKLAETRGDLREIRLSGAELLQRLLKLESRHRVLKTTFLCAAVAVVIFIVIYGFRVDADLTLAGVDQTQTVSLIELPEGYRVESTKWSDFAHYEIACDAFDDLFTLAGSEQDAMPTLKLKPQSTPYEVDVYLFEAEAPDFAQLDVQMPCAVAEDQMGPIRFQFLRPDGRYFTLASVPMVALKDVKITGLGCEWVERVEEEKISSYLARYGPATSRLPSRRCDIDGMTHYKLFFTIAHADQDLTIHHSRSFLYCLGATLCLVAVISCSLILFLLARCKEKSQKRAKELQEEYTYFARQESDDGQGPDDNEAKPNSDQEKYPARED